MSGEARALAMTAAAIAGAILLAAAIGGIAAPDQLRWLFGLICHGIEARSFVIGESPMLVCARCSGIYLGLLLGAALFALGPAAWNRSGSMLFLLAVIPLVIDGSGQAIGLWTSGNLLRAATGLAAGGGFILWALLQVGRRANTGRRTVRYS
jgi:uncharacterized membrane protein